MCYGTLHRGEVCKGFPVVILVVVEFTVFIEQSDIAFFVNPNLVDFLSWQMYSCHDRFSYEAVGASLCIIDNNT